MLHLRIMLLSALMFSFAAACFAASGKTMSVQITESEMRASPSGLGSIVAKLKYGDVLQVTEEKGAWAKATAQNGASGWVPKSSLVRGTLKITAGKDDATVAASGEEMALATKGLFDPETEVQFKKQNPTADFTWVEKMLKFKVPTDKMLAFLKEGGLEAKGDVK